MKVLLFKYPRNKITDILISLFCILTIILIFQYDDRIKTLSVNSSAEDVVYFLNSFGWEIDKDSKTVSEIILKAEPFQTFSEYNEIQKEQGFDLEPYVGKKLLKYTFSVKNYPGFENTDCIYASVFTYEGKIIAADIYSSSLNGFMQGVKNNFAEDSTG